MLIHKPYDLAIFYPDGTTAHQVLKEYELHLINLNEQVLSGKIDRYVIGRVPTYFFNSAFYSGFYICEDEPAADPKRAVDLRVNEGMIFSAATKKELKLLIENYLHGLAFEEQADLDRKAAQAARAKAKV